MLGTSLKCLKGRKKPSIVTEGQTVEVRLESGQGADRVGSGGTWQEPGFYHGYERKPSVGFMCDMIYT